MGVFLVQDYRRFLRLAIADIGLAAVQARPHIARRGPHARPAVGYTTAALVGMTRFGRGGALLSPIYEKGRCRMSLSRCALALSVMVVCAGLAAPSAQTPAAKAAAGPVIVVDTAKGAIEIELAPSEAPKSVARILDLVKTNFYRGQRVHHVQPGIVQFGDPQTRNMQKAPDWGFGGSGRPIGVKETSKHTFDRGAVGYAYRTDQRPEDADSQIFILRIANPTLNGKYAYLGHVTKGMEIVDKLAVPDLIKNVTLKP
jgi:peptidyl-prolyl cis-trans isomerase A (cyclophilin A)